MNKNINEALLSEIERFDKIIDAEALVRLMAGLYDRESGGFYYSLSARDNEGFYPDIESTAQAITLLSSLGLFSYRRAGEVPDFFRDGLINFFRARQDRETGYFFDRQFGKEVTESKKGRNTGQATARLREMGVSPLYPTPDQRVNTESDKAKEVLAEQYSSKEKFRTWLDSMEWDSDDGYKQYYYGNMLSAAKMSIEAAGFLDYTRDYISGVQNADTGLWGKKCDSMAMNAAMKISFLYDDVHKYPNVEKMIDSVARIVESEEPYSVSTLWNPLVLVRNIIRYYGDIPAELGELINEKKLPLFRTCIDRIVRFKKPDGGFSYYPDVSCKTSQGVTVSLGLKESDVNGTMLATASMRDTMHIIAGLGHKSYPLTGYDGLFFNLINS